jgi:hypothetical protein
MKLSDLKMEQVKSIACPRCGARPGQLCIFVYMGESRDGLHRDRKSAAKRWFDALGRATAKPLGEHKKKRRNLPAL